MSERKVVMVELPDGLDKDWLEMLLKSSPIKASFDKAYAGRIAECVFDITYVADVFINEGKIAPPEDSRELYQKILDLAYEFEDEYDEMKDDYLTKITDFAEKRIMEEFGENEYQKAEKIVKGIYRTRIGNPLENLLDTGYAWWLWKGVKNETELEAIKTYCFGENSDHEDYAPKSYPCSVVTFSDDIGGGTMLEPESLGCQIKTYLKNLGSAIGGENQERS